MLFCSDGPESLRIIPKKRSFDWRSACLCYPDITNLIGISNLFHVIVDYLVRDQACMVSCVPKQNPNIQKLIEFRLEANVNTYAAYMNETASTRLDSHDFTYSNGPYTYHDTYVGSEQFAGEEAVWLDGKARYAMNYFWPCAGTAIQR